MFAVPSSQISSMTGFFPIIATYLLALPALVLRLRILDIKSDRSNINLLVLSAIRRFSLRAINCSFDEEPEMPRLLYLEVITQIVSPVHFSVRT